MKEKLRGKGIVLSDGIIVLSDGNEDD